MKFKFEQTLFKQSLIKIFSSDIFKEIDTDDEAQNEKDQLGNNIQTQKNYRIKHSKLLCREMLPEKKRKTK